MKKNIKQIAFALAFIATATLLISCSTQTKKAAPTQSQADQTQRPQEKQKLMVSFFPIYGFVLNLMKDIPSVDVELLTSPKTGCLHDYQLTTGDMKNLEGAKVLAINGLGMEMFLQKIIDQKPDLKIIDSSKNIEIVLENRGHEKENETPIEQQGDNEQDEDHDHVINQHVWTSTKNAIDQVSTLSKNLQELYPDFAQQIAKNEVEYIDKLETLQTQISQVLENDKGKKVIALHEGFAYFANEWKIDVAATIQKDEHEEPTAQEIADVIKLIKDEKATVILTDKHYDDKIAQTIAKETGAKVYALDLTISGEIEKAQQAYLENMLQNAKTIHEALAAQS